MLKKTITYEDFDGNSVTEELYFNLTKAEVFEFKLMFDDGFDQVLMNMVKANNNQGVFNELKKIILATYGERMEVNGRTVFNKTQEIRHNFEHSAAFDAFIWGLIEGGEAAMADFIIAVAPKDFTKDVDVHAIMKTASEEFSEETLQRPSFPEPTLPDPQV